MQQLRECQSSKTVALMRDCQLEFLQILMALQKHRKTEPPPSVAEINLTAFKPGKTSVWGGFFCTVFYIACKRSSVIYRFLGVC